MQLSQLDQARSGLKRGHESAGAGTGWRPVSPKRDIVISTIEHAIHHEYGSGKHQHHYFHVVFHAVGTAIKARRGINFR
jgi:hypothetical protein